MNWELQIHPPVALDPSSFPVELLLVWHNLKWAFITMVGLGEKEKTNKKNAKEERGEV